MFCQLTVAVTTIDRTMTAKSSIWSCFPLRKDNNCDDDRRFADVLCIWIRTDERGIQLMQIIGIRAQKDHIIFLKGKKIRKMEKTLIEPSRN